MSLPGSCQTTRSKKLSVYQRRAGSPGICRTWAISRSIAPSVLDADVARFGEEAHGFEAALASHARLLHAAHGHAQVPEQPAVHPDQPRLEPLGYPVAAGQVAAP